jgi:hypothetical protein
VRTVTKALVSLPILLYTVIDEIRTKGKDCGVLRTMVNEDDTVNRKSMKVLSKLNFME